MKPKSTKSEETFADKVASKYPHAVQKQDGIFIPYEPDLEYGMDEGRKHFKRWDSNK